MQINLLIFRTTNTEKWMLYALKYGLHIQKHNQSVILQRDLFDWKVNGLGIFTSDVKSFSMKNANKNGADMQQYKPANKNAHIFNISTTTNPSNARFHRWNLIINTHCKRSTNKKKNHKEWKSFEIIKLKSEP